MYLLFSEIAYNVSYYNQDNTFLKYNLYDFWPIDALAWMYVFWVVFNRIFLFLLSIISYVIFLC